MATKKTSSGSKKSSSGSDPKSKRIVKSKVGETMHEFKRHQLKSGGGGKKVSNPKQAIAIGLSEARRSGANIPPDPNQKKRATRKPASKSAKKVSATTKKTAGKKTATKKTPVKKTSAKKSTARKR